MQLPSRSQSCSRPSIPPPGRSRVAAYLQSQPLPHYRPYAGRSGILERIDEDGIRTVGRFVNRKLKRERLASESAATRT
jgi:hypothetical protein